MSNPQWGGSYRSSPYSGGSRSPGVNRMNPEGGGWGGWRPGQSYTSMQNTMNRYNNLSSTPWGNPFGQEQYQWSFNKDTGDMELMAGVPWQLQRQNELYGQMMQMMGQPQGQFSGQGQGQGLVGGGPEYGRAPGWNQPGAFSGGQYQAPQGYSGASYEQMQGWNPSAISGVLAQGYQGLAPGSSLDPQAVINASLPGLDEARQQGFAGAGARAGQSGFAMSTPYAEALGGVERKTQNDLSQLTQGMLYDASKFKAEQDLAAQQAALDRSLSAWGTEGQWGHEGQLSDLAREFDAWRTTGGWEHEGQLADLAREFGAWQQEGDWQTQENQYKYNVWNQQNQLANNDYWNQQNLNYNWQMQGNQQANDQYNLDMNMLMQLYGQMGGY